MSLLRIAVTALKSVCFLAVVVAVLLIAGVMTAEGAAASDESASPAPWRR